MFTIQKSKSKPKSTQGKCTPNILPCRINHNGPVDVSRRYWDPSCREGKTTAYFRGRKLYARCLRVPGGYRGAVGVKTGRVLPAARIESGKDEEEDGDEEQDGNVEVKIIEEVAAFEELVVWGHEAVMDEGDPYVRGMEEWIGFAESIHSFDVGGNDGLKKKGGE